MKAGLLIVVAVATLASACAGSPTEPTSSSTSNVTPTSYGFEASFTRGETAFYSFTVTTSGTATVTLASVSRTGTFTALPIRLRVGLGVPQGEGCGVTESVEALPSLTPQLTTSLPTGIHCVSVADIGNVDGTVTAAIKFTHSGSADSTASGQTSTSPSSETWSSMLGPGGTASRSIAATQAGTITLRLISADVPFGIGIGVPRGDGISCRLTTSVLATSGDASVAIDVPSAGTYCAAVFDEIRAVVKEAMFNAQIVYP